MMEANAQLELFELPTQTSQRRGSASVGSVSLRYDHAVLATIVGLIGCSVVFALGVERGKQLVRAERPLLDARPPIRDHAASTHTPSQEASAAPSATPSRSPNASAPATMPPPKATPSLGKGRRAPVKLATSQSRFAVQVVSYRQLQLARRELERLRQRGEQAFLVTKHGTVALLVGPFPTKANASEKRARLRAHYQDCFIRTL